MFKKFLTILCICIWSLFTYSNNSYSKNYSISTTYLQNVHLIGNSEIVFTLPNAYDLKYLYPFSLVAPSGGQLISYLPQQIDIYNPTVKVPLLYSLEEKGAYKVIFKGIEKLTNKPITLLGTFYYR